MECKSYQSYARGEASGNMGVKTRKRPSSVVDGVATGPAAEMRLGVPPGQAALLRAESYERDH